MHQCRSHPENVTQMLNSLLEQIVLQIARVVLLINLMKLMEREVQLMSQYHIRIFVMEVS